MAKQHRVTSVDVARASGVSRATVSYVLNNDPRQSIPAETRERVLAAVRELGYQPSPAARTLRAGSSQVVLAVLPFAQVDPGLAISLQALATALAQHRYSLIWHIGRSAGDATHPAANISPAVVVSYIDAPCAADLAFLQQFQAPVVTLDGAAYGAAVGELQAAHLHGRGWRRLAFVAPERADVQRLASARLSGVASACAALGIAPPAVVRMPRSRDAARAAVADLLAAGGPVGFCCYNDEIAFMLLAALADLDVAVPEAAAVIGCDDIPLAPFSTPALTSVSLHQADVLGDLVRHILATAAGEPPPPIPSVPLSVVERRSA